MKTTTIIKIIIVIKTKPTKTINVALMTTTVIFNENDFNNDYNKKIFFRSYKRNNENKLKSNDNNNKNNDDNKSNNDNNNSNNNENDFNNIKNNDNNNGKIKKHYSTIAAKICKFIIDFVLHKDYIVFCIVRKLSIDSPIQY